LASPTGGNAESQPPVGYGQRSGSLRLLGISEDGEFVASFNRRNLFLAAEPRHDGLAQTLAFLERHRGQSGIIYCGKRRQVDEVSAALNANGWLALPYHAGLDDAVRRQNQERFIQDEVPLMVATIAFGLGINKPNVRFVIHYHLPKDPEGYYQEIGRAGRDGLPADCFLLYTRGDAFVHRHFIEQGAETESAGRLARLNALMSYAEARDCRRIPLLAYFGETLASPCGNCDNCRPAAEGGETTDVTEPARKFLACVQRTGQVFGAAHIIAVLRGSRSKKVLASRHDKVSTFGTGMEHSADAWHELAQHFVRQGLVDADPEFGGLRLAPKGWQVLKGGSVRARLTSAAADAAPRRIVGPVSRRRCDEIGELFQAGHSLDEIAQRYSIQRATVVAHLHDFRQGGGRLDAGRLLAFSTLSEMERRRVLAAFERLGLERLAPVHEALSGAVAYDELHLLRLYALCRAETPV
jgi:superfamily II DNA helicase RecQ